MNNDLSNQLRSLNTFEWMARPATTKQICFDAADHIEKLEAALRLYACKSTCPNCYGQVQDTRYCGWTARKALEDSQ